MKQIATEENVRKAYSQLKEENAEITVGNIRKILGGGSNCTILEILHTIEEENADTVICSYDPDEDKIIKEYAIPLVQGVYRQCKKRTEELAKAQYRNLASADQEIKDKIKHIDDIEEQAKYRVEAAEAKMNVALNKNEVANSKIQELESALKQSTDEIKELKQQVKELKQLQEQQEITNSMLKEVLKQLQESK